MEFMKKIFDPIRLQNFHIRTPLLAKGRLTSLGILLHLQQTHADKLNIVKLVGHGTSLQY